MEIAKNNYLLGNLKMSLDSQNVGEGVLYHLLTSRKYRFYGIPVENGQNHLQEILLNDHKKIY